MSKNEIDENVIMKVSDWGYTKAVDGIPGFDSASELAGNYLSKQNDPRQCAKALVHWQTTKAGISGFLTGLGGIITLPVTIPVNLASVLYVQIRMIAAIAVMGGYDIKDDRVKSLVYACMAGNSAKDILKDVGVVVGKRLAIQSIKNISGKTITTINQKVGFRLLTKFGEKGVINLGKTVPLLGGVIGGAFDVVATKAIAKIAIETFIPRACPHS